MLLPRGCRGRATRALRTRAATSWHLRMTTAIHGPISFERSSTCLTKTALVWWAAALFSTILAMRASVSRICRRQSTSGREASWRRDSSTGRTWRSNATLSALSANLIRCLVLEHRAWRERIPTTLLAPFGPGGGTVTDPRAVVAHHHGRKPGHDAEMQRRGYDRGRGAYYMKHLLSARSRRVYLSSWYWQTRHHLRHRLIGRLWRELAGAALEHGAALRQLSAATRRRPTATARSARRACVTRAVRLRSWRPKLDG